MFGVACGFAFLSFCVGLGFGAIFEGYSIFYVTIKYLGAAYMLYFTWKIATSEPLNMDAIAAAEKSRWGFCKHAPCYGSIRKAGR